MINPSAILVVAPYWFRKERLRSKLPTRINGIGLIRVQLKRMAKIKFGETHPSAYGLPRLQSWRLLLIGSVY